MLLRFLNKEFLAGVNFGAISMFFAWLIFGWFAMSLVGLYVLVSVVYWFKGRKAQQAVPVFTVRAESPFEPIDELDTLTGTFDQNDLGLLGPEIKE